jgi:ribosomal protein S18 acetylase RimI-like enzyme
MAHLMKLKTIHESINDQVRITYWSEDDFNDEFEFDIWVAADQADEIARKSGIRIGRDKQLSWIAINNKDDVVGALWSSLTNDDDEQPVFDFDVAVDPQWRGGSVGLRLIEKAIEDFRHLDVDNVYMRVWVVNPKLVRVLEKKYQFEIESQYSDGSAHMILAN